MATNANVSTLRPLSAWQKAAFVFGNLGWSLASYGVSNLLNYFYVPNLVDGTPMFPRFIRTGSVVLGLTIVGLVAFGGRLFDAITDPMIAGMSDRSGHRLGKRRVYMAVSAGPLGLFSLLVFVPLSPVQIGANVVWLVATLLLFYLFFTMYMVTISAWVSELGHSSRERLDLATLSSIGWAVGFALGNLAYAIQGGFERAGADPMRAFQYTMAIFSVVSVVALLLPVLAIPERNHAREATSGVGSFTAMVRTLKDRNFVVFLVSQFFYWIALTFIQTGIAYIAVTLLGLDKSFASLAMTVLFVTSFVFYVPVNVAARRYGKKPMLAAAFVLLSLGYVFTFFAGWYPFPPRAQGLVIALITSLPIAIFTIIPFALIADMAEVNGRRTGNHKAGMYFAVRGLVMKGGIAVSSLLFPTIVLWGGEEVTASGVRATAVAAFVACVIGAGIIIRWFEEPALQAPHD